MKAVLIGYGEIGKGVATLCKGRHKVAIADLANGWEPAGKDLEKVDVLLVAIPWDNSFKASVRMWQLKLGTALCSTIIFSTVPIGTCTELDAVHFPVEAKHPNIACDLLLNKNCYLGGQDHLARKFLSRMGLRFTVLDDPRWTEFLKLRSTTLYGVNIEFARYTKDVCDKIGLNYEVIKNYDKAHNRLTISRGTPEHARYIMDAPDGLIGGHCVVPNAVILQKQFPNNMIDEIISNNTNNNDTKELVYNINYTMPIMKRDKRYVKVNIALIGPEVKE